MTENNEKIARAFAALAQIAGRINTAVTKVQRCITPLDKPDRVVAIRAIPIGLTADEARVWPGRAIAFFKWLLGPQFYELAHRLNQGYAAAIAGDGLSYQIGTREHCDAWLHNNAGGRGVLIVAALPTQQQQQQQQQQPDDEVLPTVITKQ